MEKFKSWEKEVKTKAFSKEGLAATIKVSLEIYNKRLA
jgi:CCR4-NOT transcriptional regulation complex NOT5 subunit